MLHQSQRNYRQQLKNPHSCHSETYTPKFTPQNIQPTTHNLKPTTYNLQPTTHNPQPKTPLLSSSPIFVILKESF